MEENSIMVFLYHQKNLVIEISLHETFHTNTFLVLL